MTVKSTCNFSTFPGMKIENKLIKHFMYMNSFKVKHFICSVVVHSIFDIHVALCTIGAGDTYRMPLIIAI